jgi:cytochrome c1
VRCALLLRVQQVYQQVCAACHSVNQLSFRNLVGVAYSEAEVKALAEEQEARPPSRAPHAHAFQGFATRVRAAWLC